MGELIDVAPGYFTDRQKELSRRTKDLEQRLDASTQAGLRLAAINKEALELGRQAELRAQALERELQAKDKRIAELEAALRRREFLRRLDEGGKR